MGGAFDKCKVDQNNIVPNIWYNIGCHKHDIWCDIGFSYMLTCCWRYDIGYDIVVNYDIVYNIIPYQG